MITRVMDYPIWSAAVAATALLMLDGAAIGYWAILGLAFGLAMWKRGAWQRDRARCRRFGRAWVGTAEKSGLANDLGLVNRSGVVPRIVSYRVERDGDLRVIDFVVPPGVTTENFAKSAQVIADALGGHRADVQAPAPGRVRVIVVDCDALQNARTAAWTRDVDPAMPNVPDDTTSATPYWFQQHPDGGGQEKAG